MNKRQLAGITTVMLVLAVAVSCVAPTPAPYPAPVPQVTADTSLDQVASRSYNAGCYREQGGNKFVCASGGEIELQSGASLDVQAGATTALSSVLAADGGITVDTSAFTVADATGATTMAGGYNSSGCTVSAAGAVSCDGAVVLDSTLAVTGTSDLQGNVSDTGGAFTIADNVLVDGAADAIQFTIQGNGTQTNVLQTWETSDGTDVGTMSVAGALALAAGITVDTSAFTVADTTGAVGMAGGYNSSGCSVSAAGALSCDGAAVLDSTLAVTGTSDLKGNIADSGGALTLADNVLVDGAADAIQLTVQGYTTQTAVLQTWEIANGTDVATMSVAGALALGAGITVDTSAFTVADATGATTMAGGYNSSGCTVSADGALSCDGAAVLDSTLAVTGTATLNGGIAVDSTMFTVADTTGATTMGGGYGGSGCTVDASGNLSCNGTGTFDGILSVAGVQTTTPIVSKAVSYAVTALNTGALITVTGNITLTLPTAAAGLNYCVYNMGGGDLTIDPFDGVDKVLVLTDAAGDRLTNTTAGDFVCLTAVDATYWVALARFGTWSDGN